MLESELKELLSKAVYTKSFLVQLREVLKKYILKTIQKELLEYLPKIFHPALLSPGCMLMKNGAPLVEGARSISLVLFIDDIKLFNRILPFGGEFISADDIDDILLEQYSDELNTIFDTLADQMTLLYGSFAEEMVYELKTHMVNQELTTWDGIRVLLVQMLDKMYSNFVI